MTGDVLANIQNGMSGFSKGQKQIANYIIESYDKAAFMTASRLGKAVNVSESTVVRFAVELGFDGYPSMQRALQEMIRNKLTSVQRIEVANDRIGNQEVLPMVLQADIDNIRRTTEELNRADFDGSVNAILEAENIYILGIRSAGAIASFVGYYFNYIFPNVHQVLSSSGSEMFERTFRIGPKDVVIGISFPRYSASTSRAMRFCRDKGATVIALTDSMQAPIARVADYTLIAKSDMVSLVDSLVAPMSVVNALIVAIGRKKEKELSRTFSELEQIWDRYEVYEKVDD